MNFAHKKTAPDGLSLSEAVAIIERLTEQSQRVLKDVLRAQKAGYKPCGHVCEYLRELIAFGLIAEADGVLRPSDALIRSRRSVTAYLRRKFDNDEYLDPDSGKFVPVPYGAEFVASVGLDSVGCRIAFPDDEITALLDFYGVNRLRGCSL